MTHYRPEYSTEELLRLALTMLDSARTDQIEKRRGKTWLIKNLTLEVIRARITARKEA
jgi:hypothetical protein